LFGNIRESFDATGYGTVITKDNIFVEGRKLAEKKRRR
jgi:hypothetical protein